MGMQLTKGSRRSWRALPASQVTVLVTGASSGIGKACAEACARAGMKVYGTSRKAGELPAASEAGAVSMIALDVTDEGSVRAAVAKILEREGKIDVVVNNAGFGIAGAIEDTSMEEAMRQFETNFFGVMRVCQAVLPAMRGAGSGRIINIGSLGGAMGLPFQGLYSASKYAIEGLTECLRYEVARHGIDVTVIQAGDVATGFTENRVRASASSGPASAYAETFTRAISAQERTEKLGIAPALVGELIVKLIRARALRVRYPIGKLSRVSLVAKSLLPSRWFERALGGYFDV